MTQDKTEGKNYASHVPHTYVHRVWIPPKVTNVYFFKITTVDVYLSVQILFNANFARMHKIAVLNTRNRRFAVCAYASRLLYNMHCAFIYTRKM